MVMTILKPKILENSEQVLVLVSVLTFLRKNGFGLSLGFQKIGSAGVSFSLGFKNFLQNRVFRFRFGFPPLATRYE